MISLLVLCWSWLVLGSPLATSFLTVSNPGPLTTQLLTISQDNEAIQFETVFTTVDVATTVFDEVTVTQAQTSVTFVTQDFYTTVEDVVTQTQASNVVNGPAAITVVS